MNLAWCPLVSSMGLAALAEASEGATGHQRLRSLNLWGCKMVTDEALSALGPALKSLTTLNLSWCRQVMEDHENRPVWPTWPVGVLSGM